MGQILSVISKSYTRLFPSVYLALPAWILLIVAPKWKATNTVVTATALGFSAFYVAIMAAINMSSDPVTASDMPFNNLREVQRLFAREGPALAGWIHYVAFDLWTAMWIVGNAKWNRVPLALVVPCLGLTMVLGPAGLLAYFGVRSMFSQRPGAGGKDD